MQESLSQLENVRTLLAEALQVPMDTIRPDLRFGDLPQWDSMGHMEIMMQLEMQMGIEVNADTISTLISIPAICDYLAKNGKG
jgi:acyl carrier protein